MRAEQSKFLASMDSSGEGLSSPEEVTQSFATNDTQEYAQDVCALCHDSTSKIPLSFLIHLQV